MFYIIYRCVPVYGDEPRKSMKGRPTMAVSTNVVGSNGRLLTVPEVQERLNAGRTTVYNLMNAGFLRSVKIGTSRRIYEGDLLQYITSLLTTADATD
jgi:excisionase family DNA binding protein